jgi:hypothetical protein
MSLVVACAGEARSLNSGEVASGLTGRGGVSVHRSGRDAGFGTDQTNEDEIVAYVSTVHVERIRLMTLSGFHLYSYIGYQKWQQLVLSRYKYQKPVVIVGNTSWAMPNTPHLSSTTSCTQTFNLHDPTSGFGILNA